LTPKSCISIPKHKSQKFDLHQNLSWRKTTSPSFPYLNNQHTENNFDSFFRLPTTSSKYITGQPRNCLQPCLSIFQISQQKWIWFQE
jgi:hypothetical protein